MLAHGLTAKKGDFNILPVTYEIDYVRVYQSLEITALTMNP
jgi:hypothetical protein